MDTNVRSANLVVLGVWAGSGGRGMPPNPVTLAGVHLWTYLLERAYRARFGFRYSFLNWLVRDDCYVVYSDGIAELVSRQVDRGLLNEVAPGEYLAQTRPTGYRDIVEIAENLSKFRTARLATLAHAALALENLLPIQDAAEIERWLRASCG